MEVDLLPARLCLWKDGLAEQGEGVAWFPPENKKSEGKKGYMF